MSVTWPSNRRIPADLYIYPLANAVGARICDITLSQQIISQTQSPTPPSTTSPAASNTKPNADKAAEDKRHFDEMVKAITPEVQL